MRFITLAWIVFVCYWKCAAAGIKQENPQPNIIVILVDDLDDVLGGLEPMAITRRLVGQYGATFTNAFVSTPVCCPSRSSILTGKYVHNHGVINNTASGNCSSRQWQNGQEKRTMATYLQAKGYQTFYAGKYLNQYGKKETGGVEHVPVGYDRWVGLVGNSRYYNYTLSVDGRRREHGQDFHLDYLTDLLAREALDFIDQTSANQPFFAMIAPPACHSPFTPAPRFSKKFAHRRAPRWPSFNRHPTDKHWLVGQQGPFPQQVIDHIDQIYRQRWQTLLSVDQMIGRIVDKLRKKGQADRTWLVVTSDHGFHMGQFSMPADKRLPYETDIRVPLLVVGNMDESTGANKTIDWLTVVSIDLAPTVLDMAGIRIPADMDGVSLLPLLIPNNGQSNKETCPIDQLPWRTSFLIEYHGEADLQDVDPQCQQDLNTTLCLNEFGCKCMDAANNTYSCLRTLSSHENSLYCQFEDNQRFVEFYDIQQDPYQLHNRAYRRHSTSYCLPNQHRRRLISLYSKCRGSRQCFR